MEQDKKYGGTAGFFGFLALLCLGLTAYNIYSIRLFEQANQTISNIPVNASVAHKIADKYVSLFIPLFGNYPTTQVLSVLLPVTLAVLTVFGVYAYRYFMQQSNKNKPQLKEVAEDDQPAIQG